VREFSLRVNCFDFGVSAAGLLRSNLGNAGYLVLLLRARFGRDLAGADVLFGTVAKYFNISAIASKWPGPSVR
jgi:hypothetical protein